MRTGRPCRCLKILRGCILLVGYLQSVSGIFRRYSRWYSSINWLTCTNAAQAYISPFFRNCCSAPFRRASVRRLFIRRKGYSFLSERNVTQLTVVNISRLQVFGPRRPPKCSRDFFAGSSSMFSGAKRDIVAPFSVGRDSAK